MDSPPTEPADRAASARVDDGLRSFASGDYEGAARAFREALSIAPDDNDVRIKLGAALSAGGEGEAAIDLYCAILAGDPQHLEALINCGNALIRLGRYAEATAYLARALQSHSDSGLASFSMGFALHASDRLRDAIVAYRAARRDPAIGIQAAANLGSVLGELGRHDEALQVYDAALAVAPNDANLRWNRAGTLLLLGHYDLGWREYEWRWRTASHAHALRHRDLPLWNGEPLQGRSILLHAEQGFGDTIQFARYVRAVAARGGRVALEVQPELKRLFAGSPGFGEVYAVGQDLPRVDLQCPLAGLPLRLGDSPQRIPYLSAQADFQAHRHPHRFDDLHVGLVWAGSPTNSADRRRSLDVAQLEPLSEVAGVVFLNLQNGPAASQAGAFGAPMLDFMQQAGDFADTARIIAALDLVVSVDTAVAHLAGALGKPVWLINRFDSCWRWLLDREDTPWYPTMRIFRQPRRGDWGSAIARVAEALAGEVLFRRRGPIS